MSAEASGLEIWSDHELKDGDERHFAVGPLELRIRRADDEIRLSESRDPGIPLPGRVVEPSGALPYAAEVEPEGDGERDWTRWAVPAGDTTLRMSPAFPDRPLVVEPERPFNLLRGAVARIYVRVPLWVRVELLGSVNTTLAEIPTTPLSDTWFGEVTEGELAYYLPTSARRSVSPELFEPHRVLCPLQLSNASEDDLPVEKIALRVAHLAVYRRDEELWADETRVRYEGEAVGSSLRMAGGPPEEAPDAERLSPPRAPTGRGFTARTFARLRHVQGLHL